jgi:hypothetical protein
MERASHEEQPASVLQGVAERLREAVRRHPRKMTRQLARQFGVPEVEVSPRYITSSIRIHFVPFPNRIVAFRTDERHLSESL